MSHSCHCEPKGKNLVSLSNRPCTLPKTLRCAQGDKAKTLRCAQGDKAKTLRCAQGDKAKTLRCAPGDKAKTLRCAPGDKAKTLRCAQGDKGSAPDDIPCQPPGLSAQNTASGKAADSEAGHNAAGRDDMRQSGCQSCLPEPVAALASPGRPKAGLYDARYVDGRSRSSGDRDPMRLPGNSIPSQLPFSTSVQALP